MAAYVHLSFTKRQSSVSLCILPDQISSKMQLEFMRKYEAANVGLLIWKENFNF